MHFKAYNAAFSSGTLDIEDESLEMPGKHFFFYYLLENDVTSLANTSLTEGHTATKLTSNTKLLKYF